MYRTVQENYFPIRELPQNVFYGMWKTFRLIGKLCDTSLEILITHAILVKGV